MGVGVGGIAATHLLGGFSDPIISPDSHTSLDRRLARKLKTYRIEVPPVKHEIDTPLGIAQSTVAAGASASDPKTCHISDLVQLGFYLCIRSCKYTKCTGHRRTGQFLPLLEFVFFVRDHLLPADALIDHFQHATQIFLTLDNQNNAIRGDTFSYFRSDSPEACPFRAGVNIFFHM